MHALVECMNAWDDNSETGEWVEVLQIVQNILLQCCLHADDQLVVQDCVKRLTAYLRRRNEVGMNEAAFQIKSMHKLIEHFIEKGMKCLSIAFT